MADHPASTGRLTMRAPASATADTITIHRLAATPASPNNTFLTLTAHAPETT